MAGKITKTRKFAKSGSVPGGRKSAKTLASAKKKIKNNDKINEETILEKKRRLMWLGVSVSAAIILLLWFFFWQFRPATTAVKTANANNDFGQMIDELQKTISNAKNSLNNINQIIDQQQAQGEQSDAVIDNLKEEINKQLESQKPTPPETTTENGQQILIFK